MIIVGRNLCSSTAQMKVSSGACSALECDGAVGRGVHTSMTRFSSLQQAYPVQFTTNQDVCSIAIEKKQNLSEMLNRTMYANAGAGRNS